MEPAEYDKLDRLEERMWWFVALHRNLDTLARRASIETSDLPILDAGCGTGGFLAQLREIYRDRPLFGVDQDTGACLRAVNKSGQPVCAGSVNDLPFAGRSIAAIFAIDVLCHRGVDEKRALEQFHRCLAEDGCLILNLPAYRWLLSRHDAAVHNVRRYTASGLRRLLHARGFRPIYVSYWNALLFPFMAIFRKLSAAEPSSDVRYYPAAIDLLCRVATGLETALLRCGMKLPFGGSVLAIAAKRGTSDA